MNGDEVGQSMNLGVRTWGALTEDSETTKFLTGIYADAGEASRRLVDAIDPVVVRPAAVQASAYVGLLA